MNDSPIFTPDLPSDVTCQTLHIISDTEALISKATASDLNDIATVTSVSRKSEMLTTRILLRDMFGKDTKLLHRHDGSPFVEGHEDLNISISHSQEYVAIATHPTLSIGVDIEHWRPTLARVKEKFLTPQEIAVYNTPSLLLLAWTAKEAVFKAARITGLSLHDINLPANPDENLATIYRQLHTFSLYTAPYNQTIVTIAVKNT